MTKDGTFLVEDGRIVGPVITSLHPVDPGSVQRVQAISADTKLVGAEYTGIYARVPALKLRASPSPAPPAARSGLRWRSVDFAIGDRVRLRKPHPCGSRDWTVVRLGADIGLVCARLQRTAS